MNVAIIGFGVEGQSALTYWQAKGASVTVCDQDIKKEVPAGILTHLGVEYLQGLEQFDIICRTAGINPNIILQQNPSVGPKITTVVNEFIQTCPTKHIIGVTGTKGKGTTCSLIARMLEAAGKQVFLGGNIGNSPLDFLQDITEDSWVVLELSSFQLYDLRYSPAIGVCLMIAPEHLNWHLNLADYINAKKNLFAHQTVTDTAIYFADNETSHTIASTSPGAKIAYYAEPGAVVRDRHIVIDDQMVCSVDELKLLGEHNWQNACAAVTAVWQVVQDIAPIRSVLTLFSGLEHRIEFVREVEGVIYYDDSFGTAPQTTIVAMAAFKQPKVLILGGSDKGIPFDELAKSVKTNNVRQVILIGATGPAIERALRQEGFTAITPGGMIMADIVQAAHDAAKKGDVVLLSPACASFGLFTDYKDRGNQFKLAVGAL